MGSLRDLSRCIVDGKTGTAPNTLLEVTVDVFGTVGPDAYADAYETDPIAGNWSLTLTVLCARVGP